MTDLLTRTRDSGFPDDFASQLEKAKAHARRAEEAAERGLAETRGFKTAQTLEQIGREMDEAANLSADSPWRQPVTPEYVTKEEAQTRIVNLMDRLNYMVGGLCGGALFLGEMRCLYNSHARQQRA